MNDGASAYASNARPDRLFLGIALAEDVRAGLGSHLEGSLGRPLQQALPGRVVPRANWHLTLRFLGATPARTAAQLRAELHAAALGQRFRIGFGGLGAFPRPNRAAVLWLGVTSGVEPLRELAAHAEAVARACGFASEDRPFRAHLTLSRIQPPRDVQSLLGEVPPFTAGMKVDEVVLFRSHPGRGPVHYEALDRFPLEGR